MSYGRVYVRDDLGYEFPDEECARQQAKCAVSLAVDLAFERGEEPRGELSFLVRSCAGDPLFLVTFDFEELVLTGTPILEKLLTRGQWKG